MCYKVFTWVTKETLKFRKTIPQLFDCIISKSRVEYMSELNQKVFDEILWFLSLGILFANKDLSVLLLPLLNNFYTIDNANVSVFHRILLFYI